MSKFGSETVRKTADLARLNLTDEEVAKFADQLGGILGYIEKLSKLDTTNVEPLTHPLSLATPLREDEVHPSPGPAVMLDVAPEQLYENYKVPQVIGGGN
jgi:aspartyl-tRNA(Asn)/glutamyl-tRNA(Gln) amidotransferase subunit C